MRKLSGSSYQDRFYVKGTGLVCTSNGFYDWSDVSFKSNISPINNALSKVNSLRGVTYNYSEQLKSTGFDDKTHYGLIAQEVEEIIPEVVTTMEDGNKAIAYSKLVPLLIEAMKEQQEQIEELKFSITQLSNIEMEGINNYLFPNPTDLQAYLDFSIPSNVKKASLKLYSYEGILTKEIIIIERDSSIISFDTSDLQAGVYTYTLIADGYILVSGKMIKK